MAAEVARPSGRPASRRVSGPGIGVKVRGRRRPHAATRIVESLKLHRRVLRLDGRPFTVSAA
jgi:hypothetical protein